MKIMIGRMLLSCFILSQFTAWGGQFTGPSYQLTMAFSSEKQRPFFQLDGATNCIIDLESTTDWVQWTFLAKTLHQLVYYPDFRFPNISRQFYRVRVTPISSTVNWKNQVNFPSDYFLSEEGLSPSRLRWIKFIILLDEPFRAYYQNCKKYLFHYDFAAANLPAFKDMSPVEFEQCTLLTNRQAAVMGALIYPPAGTELEYGIQFLGYDKYAPAQIAQWFDLIRSTVVANTNITAIYLPENQQDLFTKETSDFFASQGIPMATMNRWQYDNLIYSSGWAAGMLKYFPLEQLPKAIEEGRLKPEDILVTSQPPLSMPSIAGIIVLTPATPNSHLAILSRSFGIPFACFSDASVHEKILSLTNHMVVLRAYDAPVSIADVFELGDVDNAAQTAALHSLKQIHPLRIEPKSQFGKWSANAEDLYPVHQKYFGGKASSYGFLRRAIPNHSRPALAFSFDLWDAFMDQPLGTSTLREAIAAKTSKYTHPPDLIQMKSDLADIQTWITDKAEWSAALKQVITNTLAKSFPASINIRFRSSSNAEDSEVFSGAGLYDSYSGCLADDLDADDLGPSHGDPTEKKERGVFRAIQKVYASLYNERAFSARLQYKIPEAQVGMGLLVHESFPDESELANGIATVSVTDTGSNFDIVTQKGPSPVANPVNGISAEEVTGQQIGPFLSLTYKSPSSLVALGQKVLTWESEYRSLCDLFTTVAQQYRDYFTNKNAFDLDFEYKKIVPGYTYIKQVREMPQKDANQVPIYLLDKPATLKVFQDEYSDLFANHRLKSTWHLQPHSGFISPTNLSAGLFKSIMVRQIMGDGIVEMEIHPDSWHFFTNSSSTLSCIDSWKFGIPDKVDQYSLLLVCERETSADKAIRIIEDCQIGPHSFHNRPVSDIQVSVTAIYPRSMPALSASGGLRFTNAETVTLAPPVALKSDCPLQIRMYETNQVRIQTRYYWPRPPLATKTVTGYVDGYTPVLIAFEETRIDGLTGDPIILRSEFSQTYRPGHHVFYEEFLFEPRLDPNINAKQKEELLRWPIQYIYMRYSPTNSIIRLLNSEGDLIPGF